MIHAVICEQITICYHVARQTPRLICVLWMTLYVQKISKPHLSAKRWLYSWVIHYTRTILINTKPHQLHWDDWILLSNEKAVRWLALWRLLWQPSQYKIQAPQKSTSVSVKTHSCNWLCSPGGQSARGNITRGTLWSFGEKRTSCFTCNSDQHITFYKQDTHHFK